MAVRNTTCSLLAVSLLACTAVPQSIAETIPTNVPEGFVPPLVTATNATGADAAILIKPSPYPPASFTLQRSKFNSPPFIWEDIAPRGGGYGIFEVPPEDQFYVYRLKHNTPDEILLDISHRPSTLATNLTLTFPFLPGWKHSVQFQDSTSSWETITSIQVTNNPLTLPADLLQNSVRILAEPPIHREDHEAIFVGGQSNALLSDNFYHWDKVTNVVFIDNEIRWRNPSRFTEIVKDSAWQYSFGIGAATELSDTLKKRYLLVPVAVGGTSMSEWMPGSNRFDRTTLFGRANFRRVAAAPQQISAIWYFGHESSTGFPYVTNYITEWKQLIAEFQKEIGPAPVIFAQLAKSTNLVYHANIFGGAEQQRLSEAGQTLGTPGHHMVVTFDLPLADGLHLCAEAHRILGHRFARAMRQHVYGEQIDGTGPRLLSVLHPLGDKQFVEVTFTQSINDPVNNYENQFKVSDSAGEIPIVGYSRTRRGQAVQLRLARVPDGPAQITYGEPAALANLQFLTNVIRNAEGLPAPAFGPLPIH